MARPPAARRKGDASQDVVLLNPGHHGSWRRTRDVAAGDPARQIAAWIRC
jgi:hypothetical protein